MPIRFWVWIALSGLAASGLEGQPPQAPHLGSLSTEGYLGIGLQDINAQLAKDLKLPEETGVEITYVELNSAAVAAGLRVGDVVIQYNGQRVDGSVQLSRLLRETPIGRQVRIQIYRNGYALYVNAKMGSKPTAQTIVIPPGSGFVPDMPVTRISWKNGLGLEWEAVDGQLASAYGVKDGGVLVRSVTAGSAAERGGLRAGGHHCSRGRHPGVDACRRHRASPGCRPRAIGQRDRGARQTRDQPYYPSRRNPPGSVASDSGQ